MLDRQTYPDAAVIKQMEQVVPFKINVDKSKDKDLAKKYRVTALPTLLCVDTDGNILDSDLGFKKPDQMIGWLKKNVGKYAAHHKEPGLDAKLEAQLKKEPRNGEVNARLALLRLEAGKVEEAKALIATAEAVKYDGKPLFDAYVSLGDRQHTAREFDLALITFEKADKIAKQPDQHSAAKVGLMDAHDGLHDEDAAKKVAKDIIKLKGAAPEHIEAAKKYLGE